MKCMEFGGFAVGEKTNRHKQSKGDRAIIESKAKNTETSSILAATRTICIEIHTNTFLLDKHTHIQICTWFRI